MTLFKKSRKGSPVSEDILREFETLIGSNLPEDYKKYMLKYNGGIQLDDRNLYFKNSISTDTKDEEIILQSFHNLKGGGSSVEDASKNYDFLPKAIVIGNIYGGLITLSLSDNDYGSIYIQFSYTDPKKVANSFTEFFNGLEYDE